MGIWCSFSAVCMPCFVSVCGFLQLTDSRFLTAVCHIHFLLYLSFFSSNLFVLSMLCVVSASLYLSWIAFVCLLLSPCSFVSKKWSGKANWTFSYFYYFCLLFKKFQKFHKHHKRLRSFGLWCSNGGKIYGLEDPTMRSVIYCFLLAYGTAVHSHHIYRMH